MPFNVDTRGSIPAFHALTGSNTTSHIAGHSKKSAWKTFQVHHHLLKNLGKGKLCTETSQNAEQYICKLYNVDSMSTTDEAQVILFNKSCSPESPPPTSNAHRITYKELIIKQPYGGKPMWPIQYYLILKSWDGRLKKLK